MLSENFQEFSSKNELMDRSERSDYEHLVSVENKTENDGAERKMLRNSLLYAVEEGEVESLVKLFFRDQKRTKILNLVRQRKYFNRGYARRFFAAAGEILASLISEECHIPASAFVSDAENDCEKSERSPEMGPLEIIAPDINSTEALLFMRACSIIVGSYLDGLVDNKQTTVSEEVLTVAEHLHGVMISLQSCGPEGIITQTSVCTMCQTWWHGKFENKELLVTQLVPTLLVKSLEINSKAINVKNVYIIRTALTLFDFEDDSISYLKSLLLKTVLCPLYHKVPEGAKFISFLFQVHESLVIELHKYIRAQIPQAKKPMLESFRDIYIRAWKESPEETRKCIEEEALQDLMYSSLYFEKSSSVRAVRAILTSFHQGKNLPEIDQLLYKMYSPILWRALKASNPSVRVNASVILAETFPLCDHSGSNGQFQECLERTVNALLSLLRDSYPRVRVAGSDAAARILHDYWTVLPSESIRLVLNQIITKHTSDTSSSAVRASAIQSITVLLKCPHSHAVLRSLLPSLGNLLHDRSERVRLSVVDMLLEVRQTKGFKFYHIIPVELLLARLSAEGEGSRPVALRLTGLLLDSYFPQGQQITGAIQVQRTLSLLSSNPAAAHVFYQNLYAHISVNSIVKLILMLLKCLRASVRADQSSENRERQVQSTDDNTSLICLTASNTAVMKTIADVMWYLWNSITENLSSRGNEACKESLFEAFSSATVAEIYTYFENKIERQNDNPSTNLVTYLNDDCLNVCSALLRCAAMVPEENLEAFSKHLKSAVSNSEEQRCPIYLSLPLSLLCLWGHQNEVLQSLAFSINAGLGNIPNRAGLPTLTEKRKNRSKSKIGEGFEVVTFVLPAVSAIQILGNMLSGSDPIYFSLRKRILCCEERINDVNAALKNQIFSIEEALKPAVYKAESFDVFVPFLALETLLRLALHKAGCSEVNTPLGSNVLSLLQWISLTVFPTTLNTHPLGDLNVSKISAVASPTSPENEMIQSWGPGIKIARASDRLSSPFLHSFTHDYDHVSSYTHAVAVVIIKTTCIILSEWMAAGGSVTEDILQEFSKWSPLLRQHTSDLDTGKELIVVFSRLAVYSLKTSGNCTLLKDLLIHNTCIESSSIKEKLVQEVVQHLLSLKESYQEASIAAILEVAISVEFSSSRSEETSVLNDDDTLKSTAAILTALEVALSVISCSGPGSTILARLILKRLRNAESNDITPMEVEKKILKILLDATASTGKYAAEVREICSMILN